METLQKLLIICDFKPLALEKMNALLNILGHSIKVTQPLLLLVFLTLKLATIMNLNCEKQWVLVINF